MACHLTIIQPTVTHCLPCKHLTKALDSRFPTCLERSHSGMHEDYSVWDLLDICGVMKWNVVGHHRHEIFSGGTWPCPQISRSITSNERASSTTWVSSA